MSFQLSFIYVHVTFNIVWLIKIEKEQAYQIKKIYSNFQHEGSIWKSQFQIAKKKLICNGVRKDFSPSFIGEQ